MIEIKVTFLKTRYFNTATYIILGFSLKDMNIILKNRETGYFELKTSEFDIALLKIPLILFLYTEEFLILDQGYIFKNYSDKWYPDIEAKLFFKNQFKIDSEVYCFLI